MALVRTGVGCAWHHRCMATSEAFPHRRRGWALAAAGMLFVSTDAFFVRLSQVDGWTLSFLMACGSVITLSCAATRAKASPGHRRWRITPPMLLIGVLNAATQVLFITAVTRSEVANVVVIVAAAPLFASVAAWVLLRERTAPRVLVAVVVTVVGIATVMSGSLGTPTLDGDLLAVGAIGAFAVTIVVWRRFPTLDRPTTLVVGSALMALGTAGFVTWSAIDTRAVLAGALMGMVFNPTGRMLYSSAPRWAPAAEVAMFAPVETVAATVWVWVAFGEQPPTATVAGGVVVLGALAFATTSRAHD